MPRNPATSNPSRLRRALSAALLALTAASATLAVVPAHATVTGEDPSAPACTQVTFIGARGSTQKDNDEFQGLGRQVYGTTHGAADLLPDATTVTYVPIRYPATLSPLSAYQASVAKGVSYTTAAIADTLRSCPHTKVVLAGYSQGAQVVHQAALAVTKTQAQHIAAVLLIADPLRNLKDNSTTDRDFGGNATHNGVMNSQGQLAFDGKPLGGKVRSFCHVGDIVCNYPPPGNRCGSLMICLRADDTIAQVLSVKIHSSFYQQSAPTTEMAKWVYAKL